MKIFYHLEPDLISTSKNSVLAIGIFDGLHLGHWKILARVKKSATLKNLKTGILTFYPHPERALNKKKVKLIQTLEQRLELFKKEKIDFCLILSLNRHLARLSGRDFARLILKDALQVKEVVVGKNFRFGHQRACGLKELKAFGQLFGFKVVAIQPVKKNSHQVSSSLIRRWLDKGRVEEAAKLLGRPYEISGQMVKGRGIGRILGFPTINLQTQNEILPPGVYISLAVIGKMTYPAVANIGFRPTFSETDQPTVEAHLIDFSGRLSGKKVSLRLLKRLRAEKKFPSPEKLKIQIARDVNQARNFFKRRARKQLLA